MTLSAAILKLLDAFKCVRAGALIILLLLAAIDSDAGGLRVTSWDLARSEWLASSGTNDLTPAQSATLQSFRNLNPDVILLQNAPDWEGCKRIASLLQPEEYQVVACSSFKDASHTVLRNGQAAILARQPALISWTDEWKADQLPASGFAFATFARDGERFGVFSLEAGSIFEPFAKAADLQQKKLLKTIQGLDGWRSNQLQGIVICGSLKTASPDPRADNRFFAGGLASAGVQNMLDWMPDGPAGDSRSIQFIYSRGISDMEHLAFAPVEGDECKPVTCDLRILKKPLSARAAPEIAAAAVQTIKTNSVPAINPKPATASAPQPVQKAQSANVEVPKPVLAATHKPEVDTLPSQGTISLLQWILMAGVLFGILTLFILAKIKRGIVESQGDASNDAAENLSVSKGSGKTMELSERERKGVVANVSLWLKQTFVQRLLSERRQLVESQKLATMAVIKLDERLTEVENQVRQRNAEYETRIVELNKELMVAQEENRELIRAKIEVLKLEIAKSNKAVPFQPPGQRN